MPFHPVRMDSITFGDSQKLVLLGGPCVIESEASALRHAEKISAIARELKVPYVFKASYDKANRSSGKSFRGPGLKEGLRILAKVKKQFDLPVISDVHSIEQVEPAGEVLDIIQIPAFLCRQTDLLWAAAKSASASAKRFIVLSPGVAGPRVGCPCGRQDFTSG